MGIMAILIKKELFLIVIGGVFVIEALSVIIQRYYFKYTKRRYGEGRRVFRMAPIHHHFQVKMRSGPAGGSQGFQVNSKITWRLHIVSVILLVMSLVLFLKVR